MTSLVPGSRGARATGAWAPGLPGCRHGGPERPPEDPGGAGTRAHNPRSFANWGTPPAPGKMLPRPGTQGAAPSTHSSPSLQPREAPAPVTTPPAASTSASSWSAQPTCKNDPGFWITVVTWNVGTAMPPDDVTSLLHLGCGGDSNGADMIAIGLQEVNCTINKRLKDALFTDQWSELFMDALAPFHFVLVSTVRMQGVILLLFAKYYHLPFLRAVQTDCTRTGLGGYWGNKGGVSVRLAAFGHMLCFLNCHLPAHMDKAEQRKDDFQTILSLQQFPGPGAHGILDHDLVFWFGDLNFRIESYDLHFVKFAIDSNQLHQLWEKDQLNMAKNTWPILKGFQEGPLNFAPTFKFDVGTNKYDTSAKKRKPAWTDRILWKVKTPAGGPSPSGRESHRLQVTQHSYRSHMEYMVSDHKPVAAQFVLRFAYRDDVPLIRLEVADEWTRPEQAVARYRVETAFARSSWDWIGLYRVGFRHCKDYVAYVWAKHEDVDGTAYQVAFSEESLPRGHGDFILGYYSHTHSMLIGVTEPFQAPSDPPAPRSRCPPRKWPAAARTAGRAARRTRTTAPWSCWHPSLAAPAPASPSATAAAAPGWPDSPAWHCGPPPVNGAGPAAAPRPRAAACPGGPLKRAGMAVARVATRRDPPGCQGPGPSHHPCLKACVCCLPCAWRLRTPVVAAPGGLTPRSRPPAACLPAPSASQGWRKGPWGPEGSGWAHLEAPCPIPSSATPPASHLWLSIPLHLPLCPGWGWGAPGIPQSGPSTSTVKLSKALPGPPSGVGQGHHGVRAQELNS
ncbi:phosphatidylinositol 4,5-bisphosphate 5-phosphatase A isoform X3 [Erinaceus europaeus]|uniref:Phosphatidylinositol 4,5-bisphosphate 5-phosphatase A isoform X3 n=1 Tax=Erinaceus europaeus TaxID=9365 RepID=A0ABM3XIR9_ERIEU|nr:phosphatidylinositol 4,5-bisphosphate 5-phosphatase A isoform X3 [Erinaceus europaeus]XP_060048716.1 phosphatidylinositol 4,5-bisphosphate 5-phosphatase A isoform X3 [Erinaceus europaeus]